MCVTRLGAISVLCLMGWGGPLSIDSVAVSGGQQDVSVESFETVHVYCESARA